MNYTQDHLWEIALIEMSRVQREVINNDHPVILVSDVCHSDITGDEWGQTGEVLA